MPKLVVNGAMLQCNKGIAPGTLSVLPTNQTTGDEQPLATVMDFQPMVNIPTFGMCSSQTNPAVISATAAAGGVQTPAPCIPLTVAPWSPGSSVATINSLKALTADSKCNCTWAGSIEITNPGGHQVSDG